MNYMSLQEHTLKLLIAVKCKFEANVIVIKVCLVLSETQSEFSIISTWPKHIKEVADSEAGRKE